MKKNQEVDVLVVTALPEEHDAFKEAVTRLAVSNGSIVIWSEEPNAEISTPYLTTLCAAEDGTLFKLGLARTLRKGGPSIGPVAGGLVQYLRPQCLAMCGVCAGNPNYLALGDVVIAEIAYQYDEGKQEENNLSPDHRHLQLGVSWVRSAQQLTSNDLPSFGEPSEEERNFWVLECMYRGVDPIKHPAKYAYVPSWSARSRALEELGYLQRERTEFKLTTTGRELVEKGLAYNVDPPTHLPFAIKVGPMASGNVVVKDGITWARLAQQGVRSCLALEMEAATIAITAYNLEVPSWIVCKGVMDHADPKKEDRYKPFAARASAEVLIKFLRKHFKSTKDRGRPRPVPGVQKAPDSVAQLAHEGISDAQKRGMILSDDGSGAMLIDMTGVQQNTPTMINDVYELLRQFSVDPEIASTNAVKRIALRNDLTRLYKIITRDLLKFKAAPSARIPLFDLNIIETFFGSLEPAYLDLFTEVSFSAPFWNKLIRTPKPSGKWQNHLHFSNDLIAEEIVNSLRSRRKKLTFGDQKQTVRLLELGTGGCNTTIAVIRAVFEAFGDKVEIEYLGFDINASFAASGNNILNLFHANVRNPSASVPSLVFQERSLRPWPGRKQFIECVNAPQGILTLLDVNTSESVDYVFTSYMLHHVANGDALLRYLCSPRIPGGIHEILGDPRQDLGYFRSRLNYYLSRNIGQKSPLEIFTSGGNRDRKMGDYLAYSLSQFLKLGGSLRESNVTKVVDHILYDMQSAQTGRGNYKGINLSWARAYFYDPQRAMLQRISELLKVDGLLVIADPDGESLFNREAMADTTIKAVEMAVAHFRTLRRILEVVGDINGVQAIRWGRVIQTVENDFDLIPSETKFMLNTLDVKDNNIGYFLVAAKTYSSKGFVMGSLIS